MHALPVPTAFVIRKKEEKKQGGKEKRHGRGWREGGGREGEGGKSKSRVWTQSE